MSEDANKELADLLEKKLRGRWPITIPAQNYTMQDIADFLSPILNQTFKDPQLIREVYMSLLICEEPAFAETKKELEAEGFPKFFVVLVQAQRQAVEFELNLAKQENREVQPLKQTAQVRVDECKMDFVDGCRLMKMFLVAKTRNDMVAAFTMTKWLVNWSAEKESAWFKLLNAPMPMVKLMDELHKTWITLK